MILLTKQKLDPKTIKQDNKYGISSGYYYLSISSHGYGFYVCKYNGKESF